MKQDGFVHLLNAANGESMGKLQNFSSKVTSIRFSSDDRLLAVGDTGYKLKLWDVEKREVIFFTFKNFFYSGKIKKTKGDQDGKSSKERRQYQRY